MIEKLINRINIFIAFNSKKILILLLVLAIIIPFVTNNTYILGLLILLAINIQLSLSSNLLVGFSGILSLGQASFFGVGAYVSAILATKFGFNFIVTTASAIAISMIVGLIIATTSLRVRGRYLAIVSLGFAEIIRIIALNWIEVTRGPQGIAAIPGIILFNNNFFSYKVKYFASLILLIISLYVMTRISKSNYGRKLNAIRDDELVSLAMGINVSWTKISVFAISAGIAGGAGALYAHYMSFINPQIFSFSQSIFILSMAILGGLGSIPGSIVGAIILTILPEILRFSSEYRQIINGIIIVLLIIFKPSGILGEISYNQIKNSESLKMAGNNEKNC